MGVGGVLPDGRALLTYGDTGANTGPMDVLAVALDGAVSTLFGGWDNEAVLRYRRFPDASTWSPCTDPRSNGDARIATNQGGSWATKTSRVTGLADLIHNFDVRPHAGAIYTCGSRAPDTAVVRKSTDNGTTWTEVVDDTATGSDGTNRFYDLQLSDGKLMVQASTTGRQYRLEASGWVQGAYAVTEVEPVLIHERRLIHHARGDLGLLPSAGLGFWTAALADDGAIWLCDTVAIYRLPPPS